MFWVAPMFGAFLAAYMYEYGSLKPDKFAGAKDLDTAVFFSDKKDASAPEQSQPIPQYDEEELEMAENPLH